MPNEPPVFAKQMNRWCISMTHSRRRRDAKRARKGVLRQMKRLLRTIGEHARRRDHLAADYAQTRFSERQATHPHHCSHRRHARATAGRDQPGPRKHHRRVTSAQRRDRSSASTNPTCRPWSGARRPARSSLATPS
ncbi:MAG: hypothetical protein J6386_04165 [Candidatus Synoicihabitans palmerolidicus]|nr:hypothetical protein [Candidatus Synoicihabitans palmerolidicus]